ncbi:MAG: TonB-dependent receptor [Gammaproteobacteria bacterium PRO9]|nr:TonB-dependent receptor [Gammaproteobacteria bacterium PRO9]
MQTGDPAAEPFAEFTATGGSEDTWALGGVVSGPVAPDTLGDSLAYRVAVQQYRSDGFRHNAFLGRNDTSNRDELTARAKLRWRPAPDVDVLLTAFHVDLDNGYDDFALDNSFTTQSDQPGEDSQVTDAASLRATIGLGGVADLISISGVANSDIVYGFDADWGNPAYWAPYTYNFTQRFDRNRDTWNQELRLVSRAGHEFLGADWLVGVYALRLEEGIRRRDTADCLADTCGVDLIYDTTTRSDYTATNLAAYGELGWQLAERTRLAVGLRAERRRARYGDSAGARITPVDHMQGGDLTLTHDLARTGGGTSTLWARMARGYKAGGFNPSVVDIPEAADRLEFKPEALWNYELGARGTSADGRWRASASVFWQERVDEQLRIPEQFRPGDPATFLFITSNAERGRNRGLELEARWLATDTLDIGASLGLLDTDIRRFSDRPELEGRELAHAPHYTFAVNATWQAGAGWFVRADYSGKTGYLIDYCQAADCNDPTTQAYGLLDLRAGRTWGHWSVEAWCRNAFDKRYAVRGFYFGNEPPAFTPTLYTRLGDPRQYGLTLKWRT